MLARPAPHSKASIISIREEEIQPYLDEQVCLPISTILVLACIPIQYVLHPREGGVFLYTPLIVAFYRDGQEGARLNLIATIQSAEFSG
jgi:hypothetical protein